MLITYKRLRAYPIDTYPFHPDEKDMVALFFPLYLLIGQLIDSSSAQATEEDHRYGVIVDCGSSGTRARIYRWLKDGNTELAGNSSLMQLVQVVKDPRTGEALVKRITPGLSSIRQDPNLASDYMRPIMDYLSSNIPVQSQMRTQIYFLGTAGLRQLPYETQKGILDDISQDIPRDYPQFNNIATRVISGIEEGFYQWLSVNTYANRLVSKFDIKDLYCQATRSRRFGLIEMGGSSVQVSYELNDHINDRILGSIRSPDQLATKAFVESQIDLDMNQSSYSRGKIRVFSTTFLGFGSNDARNLSVSLLIRESAKGSLSSSLDNPKGTITIADPCLPLGAKEIHRQPVELLLNPHRPISYDYALDDNDDDRSIEVRLFGIGHFASCKRLLDRVILTSKQELLNCYDGRSQNQDTPCSTHLLGKSFIPFDLFQFLGLGEFYYTTNLMIRSSGQFKLPVILRRLNNICSTPYNRLLAIYPEANRIDKSRVRLECFKATWLLALLQVGFRMPFNNEFKTVNEINENSLDWTIGAMIVRLLAGK